MAAGNRHLKSHPHASGGGLPHQEAYHSRYPPQTTFQHSHFHICDSHKQPPATAAGDRFLRDNRLNGGLSHQQTESSSCCRRPSAARAGITVPALSKHLITCSMSSLHACLRTPCLLVWWTCWTWPRTDACTKHMMHAASRQDKASPDLLHGIAGRWHEHISVPKSFVYVYDMPSKFNTDILDLPTIWHPEAVRHRPGI